MFVKLVDYRHRGSFDRCQALAHISAAPSRGSRSDSRRPLDLTLKKPTKVMSPKRDLYGAAFGKYLKKPLKLKLIKI